MTVDNLIAADVVLADGRLVRATSARDHLPICSGRFAAAAAISASSHLSSHRLHPVGSADHRADSSSIRSRARRKCSPSTPTSCGRRRMRSSPQPCS